MSPPRNLRLAAQIAVLTVTAVATAAAAPEAAKKLAPIHSVEGITEYRLDNGLQVLLFQDPSKPTVTVNITYMVGSRHEGRGEAGMAHLLEHMVFKGTAKIPTIWSALEDHGARFNGTTWVDRTNYYETVPASAENLEFAIGMEADRMVNSRISGDDLKTEFTVVRNEFEMGQNQPDWQLSERMMSTAYLWHNYGKSTIGNRSDIERVPIPNLRAFYEKYYQPDNAILVVAGLFETDQALALISKHFGPIPRPARKLEETYTVEPVQDGARFVTLRRVGDVAAAGLIYHIPAGAHPDLAAIQVLQDVLTSEPGGRLYKALVEAGIATSIDGAAYAWAEPGILELQAQLRADQNGRQVLDTMVEVVEGLGAQTIDEAEVERVKTRQLKNIKLAMADSGRIGVQLSEWSALGDWRMMFLHRDRLKAVTAADVTRVAKAYLMESNRTGGLFIPTQDPGRAEIPAAPSVAALVKDYKGQETIEQGEAFDATTANIDARTTRSEPRPGLKVALLPKETRGDAVRANFQFHFGDAAALTGHRAALAVLPDVLMRGTTGRTYQQLRDEIDRLQSRVSLTGDQGTVTATIESDRDNIVAIIKLLAEVLQQPSFVADEFAIVQKEQLAAAEEQLADPQARASTALRRAMSAWPKESVFYVPSLEETVADLKGLDVAAMKRLHEALYGASFAELAVVGDFDAEAVQATLVGSFGDWKSAAKYVRLDQPYRPLEAQSIALVTPDKEMAMVVSGTTFELRDDAPEFPALEFATYVLGRGAKSRLLNRLRQQEGLSYGAGAFFNADKRIARAGIGGYAICATENVHRAQEVMREELDKWVASGVTAEELAEGKVSYTAKFDNQLADDRFVVGNLASGLELGRTLAFDQGIVDQVNALTLPAIQASLDKHLKSAQFVEVKAGDLAKATTDVEKGASK